MNKIAIFILMTTLALKSNAQPLFTYGKYSVSKEEFLRQFQRNLNPKEDRKKALEEYLPLFINYKLKVQDAYDRHLDTSYNQLQELASFRQQIENNSITDEANMTALLDEAFQRSQKDIRLQDILIGFDPKDEKSVADAQAAANKAMQKLQAGTDFDNVLYEFCTENSFRASKGDLGWCTVFSLPYKIETAAYALPVGKYSQPIRTSKAFHIIKKNNERKAVGKVKIAQILFAYQPESSDEMKRLVKVKADSMYKLLMNGADFSNMAKAFSNDKTSYLSGGELPEFGVGSYETAFEDQAFVLKQKGDISAPFASSYGVHILKLLDKSPAVADSKDAVNTAALKQKLVNDNRMELAKAELITKTQGKIGYKPNKVLNKKALWEYCDSTLKNKAVPGILGVDGKTELFSYTKQKVTANDFLAYLRTRNIFQGQSEANYNELFGQFINAASEQYYKQHLEEYNPEFKNLLQEFKDANLNFEVTEKMVWTKAAQDSLGLAKQYAANKEKYKWGPSVDAIIVTSNDPDITPKVREEMQASIADWRVVTKKYENKILADSNRFEQSQIPIPENVRFVITEKAFTPIASNKQDKSETFCYVIKKMDAPSQRSFDDARGFVINDYQQTLEASWLDNLKKKYPVKINDAVWQGLLKK